MEKRTLSVLLTCVDVLLVQCLEYRLPYDSGNVYFGQRIMNGLQGIPEDFKYLVLLHTNQRWWDGVVISERYILTVAHWVSDSNCPGLEIFPSTWRVEEIAKFHAFDCFVHTQFSYPDLSYDIALIKTRQNLLRDSAFRKIRLPDTGTRFIPGTWAVIVGWGMKEDRSSPTELMRGDVLVNNDEACNLRYKLAAPYCISNSHCTLKDLPPSIMCTLGQGSTPPGACYGDGGGPLVINGVLAGLIIGSVMNGENCGNGTVTLHTNIVHHLTWIYQFISPQRRRIRHRGTDGPYRGLGYF